MKILLTIRWFDSTHDQKKLSNVIQNIPNIYMQLQKED